MEFLELSFDRNSGTDYRGAFGGQFEDFAVSGRGPFAMEPCSDFLLHL